MIISGARVKAIFQKELRDYRRNRAVVVVMITLPLIFILQPLINIFLLPSSSATALRHGEILLYMLGIPAITPALLAAYSVVGERQQGTLEPLLTTPVRPEEFLLGKALATLVPSLAISYGVYALVLASVELFAQPSVASAVVHGPALIAQLVFTPLLAGWSIWIGIAFSTRVSDVRVAQQLGMVASVPSAVVTSLFAYSVIPASLGLALGLVLVLLVLNGLGWRITSAMFDRERLVTGTK